MRFERSEVKLGGAGNVANNLAALGIRVEAVGLLGRDSAGRRIRELCRRAGIETRGLLSHAGHESPIKTRILAGAVQTTRQQLLRIDRGGILTDPALREEVAVAAEEAARRADVVVISDYGGGIAGLAVARRARRWARRQPVCVDSRYALSIFEGVTVAKPNLPELLALMGGGGAEALTFAAFVRAGRRLLAKQRWGALLVTRGQDGLALLESGKPPRSWPVHGSTEAVDVTGAGDTVLAVFAAALAATGELALAAELANVAGGLVVQKPGTATISAAELEAALASPR